MIPNFHQRIDFFNKMNDVHISDSRYEHAQHIWNEFQCDELILTDFFEKFRGTCLSNYGLNPLHYYTSPGLARDAAMKLSRVNLEMVTDIDMYKFIEQSMRGGISIISNRYATNLPDITGQLRTRLIYICRRMDSNS